MLKTHVLIIPYCNIITKVYLKNYENSYKLSEKNL